MRNSDYWKQRFVQLEKGQNEIGVSAFSSVEQQYRQAQKEIEGEIAIWYQRFADNNKISLAQSRQWLTVANLKEFKRDVQDYIKYGQKHALSGSWEKGLESVLSKSRISKLEALKIQTQHSLEVMFADQHKMISDTMKKVYINGYYHTAYELQRGINYGWDISGLEQSQIEKIISKPWAADKFNFSQRILNSKQKLIADIQKELTQNLLTGGDPQKAINAIAKKINTSKNNAERLIMTEQAYFSSAAQEKCYEDLGIEQYEIIATLDSHTSDICQNLNGKVFPIKDYEVGVTAPPFHVFCRSTTAPVFDENLELDGKQLPKNISYEDWKKEYVDNRNTAVNVEKPNADNSKFYKPVKFDTNDVYTDIKVSNAGISSDITAYRAANTKNNVYISQNAKVKPKFQHEIDTRFTEVYKLLGVQDRTDKPLICIIGFDEMGSNAIASFNAVKNTLYVSDKILELEETFGSQLACPGNELSTILHECLHWKDAADYASKFGKITQQNYSSEYIPYLNEICRKKLDKLEETGYNIYHISEYASSELRKANYDEAMVEYNVKKILKG